MTKTTQPRFTTGTTVCFRDDFSAKLQGIEFVIDVAAKQIGRASCRERV